MIAIYRETKRGCSHVLWKEIVPASHASFMALFLLCYKPSDLGSCFPFVVRCPCMNSVFVPAKTEMSKLAIRAAKLVPIGMLTVCRKIRN